MTTTTLRFCGIKAVWPHSPEQRVLGPGGVTRHWWVIAASLVVLTGTSRSAAAQAAGTVAVRVTVVRAEAGRDELAAARRMADSVAGRRIDIGVATVRRVAVRPAAPRTEDRPRRVVVIHFLKN